MGCVTDDIPIACKLDATEAREQIHRWRKVGAGLITCESAPGGVVMSFHGSVADDVRAVAAIEAECCEFLDLAVRDVGNQVRLEITSSQPEGMPVIELLVDNVRASDARDRT